jgi:hypothetical protein
MSVFKGLRPIQIKIFPAACRPPDISGLAPSRPFVTSIHRKTITNISDFSNQRYSRPVFQILAVRSPDLDTTRFGFVGGGPVSAAHCPSLSRPGRKQASSLVVEGRGMMLRSRLYSLFRLEKFGEVVRAASFSPLPTSGSWLDDRNQLPPRPARVVIPYQLSRSDLTQGP